MVKDHGGRNTVMRKLREMGILMKTSTLPFQKYVEAGYFEVNQEIDPENGRLLPFATITGKGQIWLHQKLIAHDNLTKNAINAIAQGVLSFSSY
jgi:phage antirepressor YoqD-like protein